MNEKLVNALSCAIAVLDGSGGGYSPEEKSAAKIELMALLESEASKR